jgi:hypothetical protein
MDESSYIKEEVWEKILRAALSDKKGRALFISTPSGRNHFYKWFKDGQSGEDPEWKSWHFTTAQNETIDPAEVEAAKRSLSSFAFKQEYLSSFDTAGTDLFKREWFKTGPEPKDGDFIVAVDLAGFTELAKGQVNRNKLDESAIAIVKVTQDGAWWVKKIKHGRWDVKDCAWTLLETIRDFRPVAFGIERGSLKNAVMSYLTDLMRKYNIYMHIQDLTHGNQKKTERVVWALQGRMEHGRVTFNEDEDWDEFLDQLLLFPTQGVHDDLPDALSYCDQLSVSNYQQDYEQDDFEAYDDISGY